MLFQDRHDAGQQLADALAPFRGQDCVVLALPRGGIPVAAEVATALDVPLDLMLVGTVAAPRQPELTIGAVVDGSPPTIVRDDEMISITGIREKQFKKLCADALSQLERRRQLYLARRQPERLTGRTVILVDDGVASGATMRAALQAARQRRPGLLVMAVPVAPPGTMENFHGKADRIVCLQMPAPFRNVGSYYENFERVSDAEVSSLLEARTPAPQHAMHLR